MGILVNKSLLEPGMNTDCGLCKRGIDLHCDFLEFYGGFVIFGLEYPAFFKDHLHDLFVCPSDAGSPDDSHGK
jgi:hypothetical protein